MDDFIRDPQSLTWIMLARLVSHGNGPLYSPAETKGFCQPNVEASVAELIAVFADGSDQAALVSLFQTSSDFFSASEATTVVAVRIVKRALEGVGIHGRCGS